MTAQLDMSPRHLRNRAIGKGLKAGKKSLMMRKLKKQYPGINDYNNEFRSTNYNFNFANDGGSTALPSMRDSHQIDSKNYHMMQNVRKSLVA